MSTFSKGDSNSAAQRGDCARLMNGAARDAWCRPPFAVHLVPPRQTRMCRRVRLCAATTVWAPSDLLMRTHETFHYPRKYCSVARSGSLIPIKYR